MRKGDIVVFKHQDKTLQNFFKVARTEGEMVFLYEMRNGVPFTDSAISARKKQLRVCTKACLEVHNESYIIDYVKDNTIYPLIKVKFTQARNMLVNRKCDVLHIMDRLAGKDVYVKYGEVKRVVKREKKRNLMRIEIGVSREYITISDLVALS